MEKLSRFVKVMAAAGSILAFVVSAQAQTQTQLLTNNDFSAGLTGWTTGPSTINSVAGTCSYNGVTTPGTETLTSAPGFTSATATTQALGSVSLTAIGKRSCVLYQDIAIPVGAISLVISGNFGIRSLGGASTSDIAIFAALYPTTDVPNYEFSAPVGGSSGRLVVGGANNTALSTQTPKTVNVTSIAGTTVRFAIINVMQSPSGGTAAFVPGANSVIGFSPVSALVTVAVAPTAPVIGTAVRGNAQATVTFTAPVSNGGSAVTGYTVTSSPAGGVDSNAGTTGLSHVITGLTNGTAYTFTVTATNAAGTSSASAATNSVTPVTVPGAPVIGTAVGGNAQATVTFTSPVSNGGSAVTGYTVVSNPAGGVDSNAGSTGLSHVITGLTNGLAYTFTAVATNAVGAGSASAASNSITPVVPVVPPTTPTPAIPTLPVSIGGASFTATPLNLSSGSGPALVNDLVTLVSNALGVQLAYREQNANGSVVLSGFNGGNLSFVPHSFQSGDLRPNGIYPNGNGQFTVVSNGLSVVIVPALVGLDQLLALLPGVVATVNDNGSITAVLNGTTYVVQPDFAVQLRQGTGVAKLIAGSDGSLRFTDAAGNSQLLAPAFLSPITVRSILQGFDPVATLTVQQDGTAAIVYFGQRYTLVADLTLGGIPADRVNQTWWQESANRYRVRIPFSGTSQGFTVR